MKTLFTTFVYLLLFFFPGTFGNTTGLTNASSCLPCLPGFYCPKTGLKEPFKKCTAGYWCIEASVNATPDQQVYGTKCPNGSYCPEGTPAPIECPKGTYQPFLQKTQLSDCRCKFVVNHGIFRIFLFIYFLRKYKIKFPLN